VSDTDLISGLQSDSLAREVSDQLDAEAGAIVADAEREARTIVARAHDAARTRMHEAMLDLRREGARRIARAEAQRDTEARRRAQRQAATAIAEALPMLRGALAERWTDAEQRMAWTSAIARVATARLAPGAWLVEHPAGWSEAEQRAFAGEAGGKLDFRAADDIGAGLRISADQAVLDGTPDGLLADERTVAAMLLNEIGNESSGGAR
jgi:F0F1-type ATP synthase membrane subunit b/b'